MTQAPPAAGAGHAARGAVVRTIWGHTGSKMITLKEVGRFDRETVFKSLWRLEFWIMIIVEDWWMDSLAI